MLELFYSDRLLVSLTGMLVSQHVCWDEITGKFACVTEPKRLMQWPERRASFSQIVDGHVARIPW